MTKVRAAELRTGTPPAIPIHRSAAPSKDVLTRLMQPRNNALAHSVLTPKLGLHDFWRYHLVSAWYRNSNITLDRR